MDSQYILLAVLRLLVANEAAAAALDTFNDNAVITNTIFSFRTLHFLSKSGCCSSNRYGGEDGGHRPQNFCDGHPKRTEVIFPSPDSGRRKRQSQNSGGVVRRGEQFPKYG